MESVHAYADYGLNHGAVSEVNIDNRLFVFYYRELKEPVDENSRRVLIQLSTSD